MRVLPLSIRPVADTVAHLPMDRFMLPFASRTALDRAGEMASTGCRAMAAPALQLRPIHATFAWRTIRNFHESPKRCARQQSLQARTVRLERGQRLRDYHDRRRIPSH